jgi:mono/diheme cytochrome c family protein
MLVVCLSMINMEARGQSVVETPYSSPKDADQGDHWLRSWCGTCHGRDARGGRGPDLTDGNFRNGDSDQDLYNNIKDGIPGTDMIGLVDVDDKIIWQLVSAIRAREKPIPPPSLEPEAIDAGRRLFTKHNCSNCHWNGKEGGRRGVDLSASTASVEYVRTSILDPDANFREVPIPAQHPNQQVVLVTASGKPIIGRWLNEDGSHILFMDDQDNLHTFSRDDIDVLSKPRNSLMPNFKDSVNERGLKQLVAYLFSIRKSPQQKGSE